MYGFYFAVTPTHGHHTFKNCVAFNNSGNNTNLSGDAIQANNSWNLSITADSADYLSLDVNLAKAARDPDGSLPGNDFAKLVSTSDLIDQGTPVGLPYLGNAPDLGPFECK